MDARFYNSEEIDIGRLATDLVNLYLAQGYQAQQIGSKDQILVQLKKGGDFEAIIGMQAALSLTLQRTAGGVLALIGQQRWIDKAAVALWALWLYRCCGRSRSPLAWEHCARPVLAIRCSIWLMAWCVSSSQTFRWGRSPST